MHRTEKKPWDTGDSLQFNYDRLATALQMSKAMQTRFKLIEESQLNNVVVAGIKDMDLAAGGIAKGKKGAFVVRFNNPSHGRSSYHRITINPGGVPSSVDPHIRVSPEVIKAAEVIQKGLKISGKALFIVSIVTSGIRVGKAVYDELDIDSEIEALESMVHDLKKDMHDSTKEERANLEKALKFAEHLLEDARDCKQNPGKKTILTTLCVAGEWCGAAALACAGAKAGAAIGAGGGPVGAIAGAVTGSVIGGVSGSKLGATAVENFHVDEDGAATEMQGCFLSLGDKIRHDVINFDGHMFVGKGVEVGARTAILQIHNIDEKKSLAVGRAGVSCGISNKGIDLSTEGKLAWLDCATGFGSVGYGFNVDTGVQITERCTQLSVLGLGFSKGDGYFEIKTPFFNINWKC